MTQMNKPHGHPAPRGHRLLAALCALALLGGVLLAAPTTVQAAFVSLLSLEFTVNGDSVVLANGENLDVAAGDALAFSNFTITNNTGSDITGEVHITCAPLNVSIVNSGLIVSYSDGQIFLGGSATVPADAAAGTVYTLELRLVDSGKNTLDDATVTLTVVDPNAPAPTPSPAPGPGEAPTPTPAPAGEAPNWAAIDHETRHHNFLMGTYYQLYDLVQGGGRSLTVDAGALGIDHIRHYMLDIVADNHLSLTVKNGADTYRFTAAGITDAMRGHNHSFDALARFKV